MKKRIDFVSNSSSSSFLLGIEGENAVKLINLTIDRYPNFKKVILPEYVVLRKDKNSSLIKKLCKFEDSLSDMIYSSIAEHTDNQVKLTQDEYLLIDMFIFRKFYCKQSRTSKNKLKSLICYLYNEDCVPTCCDDLASDFTKDLRTYLQSKEITYTTSEMFV